MGPSHGRQLPKTAICVYSYGLTGRALDFTGTFKKGFSKGLSLTVDMIKVIVPFYLIVELIRYLGFIQVIGGFFGPL